MSVQVLDGNGNLQTVETLPSVGQKAAAASLPVVLASDQSALSVTVPGGVTTTPAASELHIGQVGGDASNGTGAITRPADTTAYASGDLVANSTTAGSVAYPVITVSRVAAGSFSLSRLRLRKSGTSTTNASFRVHLFRSAPSTFANGDNGAFSSNGVANYLGSIDVTIDQAFTDGASGTAGFTAQPTIKLASGSSLSWALEARAAYTPVSAEVFTLEIEAVQG